MKIKIAAGLVITLIFLFCMFVPVLLGVKIKEIGIIMVVSCVIFSFGCLQVKVVELCAWVYKKLTN